VPALLELPVWTESIQGRPSMQKPMPMLGALLLLQRLPAPSSILTWT